MNKPQHAQPKGRQPRKGGFWWYLILACLIVVLPLLNTFVSTPQEIGWQVLEKILGPRSARTSSELSIKPTTSPAHLSTYVS